MKREQNKLNFYYREVLSAGKVSIGAFAVFCKAKNALFTEKIS